MGVMDRKTLTVRVRASCPGAKSVPGGGRSVAVQGGISAARGACGHVKYGENFSGPSQRYGEREVVAGTDAYNETIPTGEDRLLATQGAIPAEVGIARTVSSSRRRRMLCTWSCSAADRGMKCVRAGRGSRGDRTSVLRASAVRPSTHPQLCEDGHESVHVDPPGPLAFLAGATEGHHKRDYAEDVEQHAKARVFGERAGHHRRRLPPGRGHRASGPGNKADAQVWCNSCLPQQCQGVTVLGDGAHINTGLVVPHRKRPGRPLLAGERAGNKELRRSVHGLSTRSAV